MDKKIKILIVILVLILFSVIIKSLINKNKQITVCIDARTSEILVNKVKLKLNKTKEPIELSALLCF